MQTRFSIAEKGWQAGKQAGKGETGIALHLLREFSWHFGRAGHLAWLGEYGQGH
jgi:hypothetical protein